MSKNSFTLIETLVAVTIFVSVVTVALTIFVSALRAQMQSLAYQQLLDQTSYVMEYMSRAIRMAKKDMHGRCIAAKLNYAFVGQCLRFKNYRGKCQQFCLDGVRLKEIKDGVRNYLTAPALRVNSFSVTLTGQTQNDHLQPLVSIFLDITGREESRIRIQTSISQRDLDVRR